MSNTSQMTLFQHETGQGPSMALAALVGDNSLGEGIRASYAILSIKASRWRVKYKKNETVIQAMNNNTNRMEPVPSLEMVIIKANPFLNKQYYAGKYVEGSNSPPDCYSLDGKVPSPAVVNKMHSNCTLCPMNQFGSLIGDNGVKQKACRDTKKLAVVPLQDLRNESLGGPMLFRVPPSSLGDLSKMADALKARGFPYNAVAVRFTFDLDASHPKPQFNAIRALTDEEAAVVLELYQSDGTAAVLADNEAVVDHEAQAPKQAPIFEQEPTVPVGQPAQQQAPVAAAPPVFAPPPPAAAPAPVLQPVQETPTVFTQQAPPPPPPGMHGSVVQAFNPNQPPPTAEATAALFAPAPAQAPNPFAAASAPVAEAAPKTRRKATAPVQLPEPVLVEPTAGAPPQAQLDDDVNSILAGLSAFTGGK